MGDVWATLGISETGLALGVGVAGREVLISAETGLDLVAGVDCTDCTEFEFSEVMASSGILVEER